MEKTGANTWDYVIRWFPTWQVRALGTGLGTARAGRHSRTHCMSLCWHRPLWEQPGWAALGPLEASRLSWCCLAQGKQEPVLLVCRDWQWPWLPAALFSPVPV